MNIIVKLLAILFIVSCFSVAVTASKQEEPVKDGQFCDICSYVVTLAEQYANQSEPQIEQALLSACSKLPTTLGNMCNTVVLVYGKQIVEFILKEESPQRVCCQLHLCTDKCNTTVVDTPVIPAVLRESNDGMCDLCTFAVGQVESFLAQNQTEEEIKASLRLVCSILPSVFEQQCQSIVDQYVPSIIYYLESEFPPAAVCGMIGLCSKKQVEVPVLPKISNDGSCDLCKFGVGQIEAWLASNDTENLIQQRLSLVCQLLPGGFKEECLSLVQQVPQIITYLEQAYTPEVICQMIGVCSSKVVAQPVVNKVQDGECALCTFAVGQIEAWVASNQTVKSIQQKLTLVCDLLPLLQNECLSLVDQVPSIIQQLEQSYTPQVICTKIGLCSSKKAIAPKPKPVIKSTDGNCEMCKFAIGQIEAWLATNQTETIIQKRLSLICNLLPGGFKDECFSLVNQVPQIITYLEQTYTPEVICQMVGVCSSKMRSNDATCAMCKFGVAQIEAWIASNATQEFIQHKLSMVCGLLPAYKDQCIALVSQVPAVINYLEQTYNADVICQMINVCTSKKVVVVPKKNDASCDLCKFAVGQIEAWLASNDTENIIQQRLAMICELLPGDFKDQCLGLVHQVPDIITWLESAYTPEAVCQILGICPTDKAVPKPVKKENDGSCSLCEFGVGQIEAWLASNQTEDLIQKRLSLICSLLPGGFKDECFSLVNQVPQIISWLESAYTPEAVCQLLGICSTKTAIVPNKPQDGECALCTFAVGQIEAWVASNQTVKSIQQKLTLVCNLLPLLQNECLSLVDQVPAIIQQLEQSYTPQVICTQLGLCSSKKVVVAPKKTNDGECALCTFAVGQIEAWVASNQTVKAIQQKLTLVCDLLPLLQNECLSLVDQVPNIIQELEQSYTPQVICTQLGLCSSKKAVAPKVLPAPVKKSNDGNCEMCKFGVGQIEAYLALNATQEQIQQELTQVCGLLSDLFKRECLDLVTRVPQIIVYLEQTYTPEVICQLLGVCSSKFAAAPKNSNDGQCALCQFGVGQIEAWLATNDTETRIQQKLTEVCNMLPSLKRECLDLVTRVPQIVTYLTQTYTPDVICQLLGQCSSKQLPAAPKGHDDILCPACMFVVGLVEQQVKANHTVADIQAALDKVCNKLPHPFADACTSIVDTYTPQIVELISKKLDPSAICTALKLCKKREREAIKTLAQVVAKNNNMICAACKQLVTIADNFITQDSTKQEITAIVENICTYVPQGYSDMCKAIIQEYGPGLIDQLASKILDPSKVCAAVQACTSSKIAASHALYQHAIKIKLN